MVPGAIRGEAALKLIHSLRGVERANQIEDNHQRGVAEGTAFSYPTDSSCGMLTSPV